MGFDLLQLLKALIDGRCNILNIVIYSIDNGTLLGKKHMYVQLVCNK